MDSRNAYAYDELDLAGFLAPLIARWKILLGAFVLGCLVAFIVSRMLPKTYQSSATVYVQQSATASLISSLPIAIAPTSGSSSGYLVTLLQSEKLLGSVGTRLRLLNNKDFLDKPSPSTDDMIEKLKKSVKVTENRNGSIRLTVRAHKPELAADIANAMVDSLGSLVVTASKKKVDFIQEKLQETEVDLAKAEDELKVFLEKNNIAVVDEQTKALIDQMTELESRLISTDQELQAVTSELENSGDVNILVDREVRKRSLESSRNYLKERITDLEEDLARLPAVATQYARLQRNTTILAKQFELLTEQYQLARITQKGEDGDYQIIDRARPIHRKVAPKTTLNMAAGGATGLLLAVVGINLSIMMSGRGGRSSSDSGSKRRAQVPVERA